MFRRYHTSVFFLSAYVLKGDDKQYNEQVSINVLLNIFRILLHTFNWDRLMTIVALI